MKKIARLRVLPNMKIRGWAKGYLLFRRSNSFGYSAESRVLSSDLFFPGSEVPNPDMHLKRLKRVNCMNVFET